MCREKTGFLGEEIAVNYLKLAGYDILERNFRSGHLEVDIIASTGGCAVFAEVKTRRSLNFGRAVEAVDREKLSHIKKAAMSYIHGASQNRKWNELRLDVITVEADIGKGRMEVRHLRGVG